MIHNEHLKKPGETIGLENLELMELFELFQTLNELSVTKVSPCCLKLTNSGVASFQYL